MGLINNNTMETSTGLTVPVGSYISIGADSLETRIEEGVYSLQFTSTTWKDQATRNAQSRAIQHKSYTVALTEVQLGTSVYTVAYNHLKTVYTNTTDI